VRDSLFLLKTDEISVQVVQKLYAIKLYRQDMHALFSDDNPTYSDLGSYRLDVVCLPLTALEKA
jgi:hypothetical protein